MAGEGDGGFDRDCGVAGEVAGGGGGEGGGDAAEMRDASLG